MGRMNTLLRRKETNRHADRGQQLPIRLSGTNPKTLNNWEQNPTDGPLGPVNGREGNDHKYPSDDFFLVNTVSGGRYQDFANSHLSEGPSPGRVPRRWNNSVWGLLGKHVTGDPAGDVGMVKAGQLGGAEDQKYIPHVGIPRGVGLARAYSRTVDDSAAIPAIYVADPTRR